MSDLQNASCLEELDLLLTMMDPEERQSQIYEVLASTAAAELVRSPYLADLITATTLILGPFLIAGRFGLQWLENPAVGEFRKIPAPDKYCNSIILPSGLPIRNLRGLPRIVKGNVDVGMTEIESLEGAPEEVHGDFRCCQCQNLRSLQGGPKWILGDFNCAGCPLLTSLQGLPRKMERLFIDPFVEFSDADMQMAISRTVRGVRRQ